MAASAGAIHRFVQTTRGSYELDGGAQECLRGSYEFQPDARGQGGTLLDESQNPVGRFSCEPIGGPPFEDGFLDGPADAPLPVIGVECGEIMEAIQDERNAGAFFVLPSQLNGAEYPSQRSVVDRIQAYSFDNTGGPRGQLAVHPAAGQFVLDNAATLRRPGGINAVDGILTETHPYGFELFNGYLTMPMPSDEGEAAKMLSAFRSHLHTLRPLIMANVPARGLLPSKRGLSQAGHSVGLVYASAVPVNAYQNQASPNTPAWDLHHKVAEAILVAQYYGALSQIARHGKARRTKVYLMPLGGGVFRNPIESIVRAMSLAVERLSKKERASLDVLVLAWNGNPSEGQTIADLLRRRNKLASTREGTPPHPKGRSFTCSFL